MTANGGSTGAPKWRFVRNKLASQVCWKSGGWAELQPDLQWAPVEKEQRCRAAGGWRSASTELGPWHGLPRGPAGPHSRPVGPTAEMKFVSWTCCPYRPCAPGNQKTMLRDYKEFWLIKAHLMWWIWHLWENSGMSIYNILMFPCEWLFEISLILWVTVSKEISITVFPQLNVSVELPTAGKQRGPLLQEGHIYVSKDTYFEVK